MSADAAHLSLIGIVVASVLLMLVRPKGIAEVWWVASGAVLLVLLRIVSLQSAWNAVRQGTDVYLFLIGMMVLSEFARVNGVFDWVSTHAVLAAKGRCARLFALLYGIGTVVTICMSNDATAVVLTPAVLLAVRKAEVEPKPHLFACAMIANAASFVLPISNPANLVVFHDNMPPLAQWLASFLIPSLCSILVTYLVLRVYFRSELSSKIECRLTQQPLGKNGKLALGGLFLVVAVLLIASASKADLGLPTCLAAIVVSVVVSLRERSNPLEFAKRVSWPTLLLVAGLFVMVNAVESVGALRYTQAALAWAQRLPVLYSIGVIGLGVGFANNLVNNLPLGLITGATMHAVHAQGLTARAVLIGVDLGPNLSVTGSLATILWLLAMRQGGLKVTAWDFLKVGVLAMPAALLASCGGLLVMHILTHW